MIYRVCGGMGLALLALDMLGVGPGLEQVTAISLLIAGIALIVGL
jgi:hypothetical protein